MNSQVKCLRPKCGYRWYTRIPGKLPKVCPRCKSHSYLERPKVKK